MTSSGSGFTLSKLAAGVVVSAEAEGVWICGWRTGDPKELARTRLGRLLGTTAL